MQQYDAGDTVEATFEFVHANRIEEINATFARTDDPTDKLRLSGQPEEQIASGGAGYTYWRVVLPSQVTVDDKLGEYRLEAVEAVYPGRRRVPFGNAPEVGILVAEKDIVSAEISADSWEWGKGATDGGEAT